PEKVLMVREDFAEGRPEEHSALVAAVFEACAFCEQPENHQQIVAALARPEYLGVPEAVLAPGLRAQIISGPAATRVVETLTIFHRHDANEPTSDKAAWVLQQMRDLLPGDEPATFGPVLGRRVFRADLFDQAVRHCADRAGRNALREDPALALVHD